MPERPTNIRWLIVLMLMGFTIQGQFNRYSITVPGTERFTGTGGMTPEQMGQVYFAFLLAYTICMLPGGWAIDRLGPKLALTGMGIGTGFCVALTGALGWLQRPILSLWLPLVVIRAFAGALSAPLHPGAARSVSLWVPLSSRATANGLVTAGALVGIAFSYPGFGALMDWRGWPTAFVICGGAMMLFTVAWHFLATDDPAAHRLVNAGERQLVQGTGSLIKASPATLREFLDLFRNRGLVLLTLSYAAVSYFQYLFFYWIEYYFEKVLHLKVSDSRQAAFTCTIAMAFGMAFGGLFSDSLCRWFGRRLGYRAVAILGMGLSAVFAWVGLASPLPSQIVLFFSLALGALGLCEGIFWTTAPLLQKKNGGLAGAFLNTVGNVGGLPAPLVTPWIGEHYGWFAALGVACVICGLGALLWFWIDPEPAPNVASP